MSKEALIQFYNACKGRGDEVDTDCMYRRNFHYNQAAAICQYVQQTFPEPEEHSCTNHLTELARQMFGDEDISGVLDEVKKSLAELREKSGALAAPTLSVTGGHSHIATYFKEASESLRQDVIVKLFDFCRKVMDMQQLEVEDGYVQRQDEYKPDWKYAVIAFGSLARSEATPYSDFEWGILVQDNGDVGSACRDYFRELTTLLHFLVIRLGETILPAMAIKELDANEFFDETTVRGFAFDGLMAQACKWPLGNLHLHDWKKEESFELIGRPEDLAQFQSTDSYSRSPEFAFSLLNAAFICGDRSLLTAYGNECAKVVNNDLGRMRTSVLHLLHEDCARYRYKAFTMMSTGTILNPKKDLYRLFDRSVLALRYCELLTSPDQFEAKPLVWLSTIEALNELICLGENGKRNIQEAVLVAMWLRLQTYRSQSGRDALAPGVDAPLELIKRYYFTAIPFGEQLFKALESASMSLKESLESQEFFADNSVLEAIVMYRLGRYQACITLLETNPEGLRIENDVDHVCKLFLANAALCIGNYGAAAEQLRTLLADEKIPDNVVMLKVSLLHALCHLPYSEHRVRLLSELRCLVLNRNTSPRSAAHIGQTLLNYYRTFNLPLEEQSLRSDLDSFQIRIVDERGAVDWSNKEAGVAWYRKKLKRLRRLYGGYSHRYLPTISEFLHYCHHHHCIDAVEDELNPVKQQDGGFWEKVVVCQFKYVQAQQQLKWAEAQDCLTELEKLLNDSKDGENDGRYLRRVLYTNKLLVHLCSGSLESNECKQCLEQSINLWENSDENEKIGSEWGSLALNIGDVQVKLKNLGEGRKFFEKAKTHYERYGDTLNVAWADSALICSYLHDGNPPGDFAERCDAMIRVFEQHREFGRLAASNRMKANLLWRQLQDASVNGFDFESINVVLNLLTAARQSFNLAKSMGAEEPVWEGDILLDLISVKIYSRTDATEEIGALMTLWERFPRQLTAHIEFLFQHI